MQHHFELKGEAEAAQINIDKEGENLSQEEMQQLQHTISLYESSECILEWFLYTVESLEFYRGDYKVWIDNYLRIATDHHPIIARRMRQIWSVDQVSFRRQLV